MIKRLIQQASLKKILLFLIRKSPLSSRFIGSPGGLIKSVERLASGNRKGLEIEHINVEQLEITVAENGDAADHLDRQTFISHLEKARILGNPYCVISADDKIFVEYSTSPDRLLKGNHPIYGYSRLPKIKYLTGKCLVLASLSDNNYYHWLFQIIPKIAYLESIGIQPKSYDHILFRSFNRQSAYISDLADIFGVPLDRARFIDRSQHSLGEIIYDHVECAQLTVTPNFWQPQPWVCRYLKNRILDGQDKPGIKYYKKIYIIRKQAAHRKIINENGLYALLDRYGFTGIAAEDFSVREQAWLFTQAKFVVAPHGAGLANLTFCGAGCQVLEIKARQHRHLHHDAYKKISRYAGLEYRLLECEGIVNEMSESSGFSLYLDLSIDLSAVENVLDEMLASAD